MAFDTSDPDVTPDDIAKHLVAQAKERRRSVEAFKPGDVVALTDRSELPDDAMLGDVGVVMGDDPRTRFTTVLCLHRNGNEIELTIRTATLEHYAVRQAPRTKKASG